MPPDATKGGKGGKVEHKPGMIRVYCPWRGGAIVWANIARRRGAVCTACGNTGHEPVEAR